MLEAYKPTKKFLTEREAKYNEERRAMTEKVITEAIASLSQLGAWETLKQHIAQERAADFESMAIQLMLTDRPVNELARAQMKAWYSALDWIFANVDGARATIEEARANLFEEDDVEDNDEIPRSSDFNG